VRAASLPRVTDIAISSYSFHRLVKSGEIRLEDTPKLARECGADAIEIATGGNILPAMASYKQFPGMEGATYYYFGIPKNPVNEAMVARHYSQYKNPPDFFTAGGFSAAMAVVTALQNSKGDARANTLIKTMEGMSFDTPKGKMTFRAEDHQAMQSMYHFKIKVDPAFPWGVPELVKEIKAEEMQVPVRNKR